MNMSRRQQAEVFTKILRETFAERLLSVVLFGSVARDDARVDSDIDLLVVIKGLPVGRFARRDLLEPVFEKALVMGCNVPINEHLKTPEEAERLTLMYYDFPTDAKLLYDHDGFFKRVIDRVSSHIQKSGAQKKKWGKFYYWDLKPGAKMDKTFEVI